MDIIISNSSGEPIYAQIAEQIKQQIASGALSEGEALPSMRLMKSSSAADIYAPFREKDASYPNAIRS